MFDFYRKMMGTVEAQENDTEVKLTGIDGIALVRDINKHWKTEKISMYMFNNVSRSSISFYKFFALEMLYMIDEIKNYRNRYTSVKTMAAIKEALYTSTWLKATLPENTINQKGRLDFSRLSNMTFTASDYQMDYFKSYTYKLDQYGMKGNLLDAAAGTGKAQPLTALVKTPGGWTTMGDIKVGDTITAWDGTPTKVTGVYPQGKKQTFTVTFKDGRTTEACDEHLWRVYCYDWTRYGGDGWKIINTSELFGRIQMGKQRLYIQLCKPEDRDDIDLPIDPYNMGAILGDGGISSTAISLTSGDPQLFELFKENLPESLTLSKRNDITMNVTCVRGQPNEYIRKLRDMDLMGTHSTTKSIPTQYLYGSVKQRLALVQGLMDTDGTVDVNSNLSFSTSSYLMAKQFQYLIRSLGGVAKLAYKEPTFTYGGEKKYGQMSYRIAIRFATPCALFRLDRKLERCNDGGQYTDNLRLQVKHVNVSDRVECQCIQIDHPDHLYITDDFIVTHNTYLSSAIAEMLNSKHVIVLCPKNALETVWPASIAEMFKTRQTLWHSGDKELGGYPSKQEFTGQRWIIAHYEAINKVMQFIDKVGTKNVTIILDESHHLNDENALRTQMYSQLCKDTKSQNIIEQSGTALKAMGAELIPFMRLIDKFFTPEVEFRFRKIFGKEAKKGADIIRNRLQAISFKIEKKETNLLPPIMRTHSIKIPNGEAFTLDSIKVDAQNFIDERWKFYKARRKVDEAFWAKAITQLKATQTGPKKAAMQDYLRDFEIVCKAGMVWEVPDQLKACTKYEKEVFEKCLPQAWVKEFRDVKSVIKYTNLKIQGECLGRIIGGKRIEAHVAMVPYVDWVGIIESTEKKTLVFSSFVEAIEACDAHWRKIGYTPLAVYGKFTNQLGAIVKRYDEDKTANPLGATYASLSTAVRLTMADTMIMLNSPFRHYILEQAVSRIYRIGQDSQCYVYQVSLDTGDKPNISTRSKDILAWSQEMVASLMGLESNFIEGDALPSLEAVFQKHEYDENKALHAILQGSFDNLGIEISKEDFDVTKVIKQTPGYMNW